MNLFSITAPLVIHYPDGERHLMVELFSHADGLLYFRPFWHMADHGDMIHVVKGDIRGDGPWKAGDCTITVAGCHGADPEIAMELANWQAYMQSPDCEYFSREHVLTEARKCGAIVE